MPRVAEGAQAPFFMRLCVPRLRDDAMLAWSLAAFEAGDMAAALLAAEYVCRRLPANAMPAILRAHIIERCAPAMAVMAWYRAWCSEPDKPLVQDLLIGAWQQAGEHARLRALAPAFLPARCRAGAGAPVVAALLASGVDACGACWRSGALIEAVLYGGAGGARRRLLLASETEQFELDAPADGTVFRFAPPRAAGVWSLAMAGERGDALPADGRGATLLAGSPLIFAGLPAGTGAQAAAPASVAPASVAPPAGARAPVAIVLPVYRGLEQVRACLTSVLASLAANRIAVRVVVVDDASPEPALSAWLDMLAADGRIELLRNRHNLGFIETTNRGLRACPSHDALLLNADTLVHGDWIDRLAAALDSADDVASVTPWSNNGEISSFPVIAQAAPTPGPDQLAQLDAAAAALRAAGGVDVDLPSCCGFAMLVRRSVLDAIGLLDGVALVRGYGEEVDWCLRARAAGYRHLLATGVFVAHAGGVSFGSEKVLRVRQNRAVVSARYPHYYPEYARFVLADPLASARERLRAALAGNSWLAEADQQSGQGRAQESDLEHDATGDLEYDAGSVNAGDSQGAALLGACIRIGVWRHEGDASYAGQLLALARLLAAREGPSIRLLVCGMVCEALWHTGVVDALPTSRAADAGVFSDAQLLALSNCVVLLHAPGVNAPAGFNTVPILPDFDAARWLASWLPAPDVACNEQALTA